MSGLSSAACPALDLSPPPPPPLTPDLCIRYGWQPLAAPRRRVFDMMLLHDEIDLLEMRLYELHNEVDIFVIAESNMTFTGKPKPSMFERHRSRFERFQNKIIHMQVQVPSNCAQQHTFLCEEYQRDYLYKAFVDAQGEADDLVMLSDVDEMPRPEVLAALRRCDFEGNAARLGIDRLLRLWAAHYIYSAHCLREGAWVWGPSAATGAFLRRYGAQQMRFPYATRTRFKAEQQRKAGLPCCVLDTQKHTMFGPYFPKLRFACSSYLTANHSRKISDHGYIAGDDSAAFVHQGNRRRSHGTTMDLAFPDVGHSMKKYGDEPSARVRQGGKITHRCAADSARKRGAARHVEELAVLDTAWHFSYFKSPEDIVVKYASVSWPKTYPPYSLPSFHLQNALRCFHPEHPKSWKINYVPHVVDVPHFALRNPCRMHIIFAYERNRTDI